MSIYSKVKDIAIFGVTGTVGDNALEVIRRNPSQYNLKVISGNENIEKLAAIAKEFDVEHVVTASKDNEKYQQLKELLKDSNVKEIASGDMAVVDAATIKVDCVLMAISGMPAIRPLFKAIENNKVIALANKESIVCGGDIIMNLAKKRGTKIIPVDSEHNAIFQILKGASDYLDFVKWEQIDKITLTASGGPFLKTPLQEMHTIKPEDAVNHPNWKMGVRISIDSATMMNKGFEVIEAAYLFNLESNKIDAVIHPQSLVHGVVDYCDGSTIMHAGVPDMKLPISHAFAWPDREYLDVPRFNLLKDKLEFAQIDKERYPAYYLAREALKLGGHFPLILFLANNYVVDAFLKGEIKFTDMPNGIEFMLESYKNEDFLEEMAGLSSDMDIIKELLD